MVTRSTVDSTKCKTKDAMITFIRPRQLTFRGAVNPKSTANNALRSVQLISGLV